MSDRKPSENDLIQDLAQKRLANRNGTAETQRELDDAVFRLQRFRNGIARRSLEERINKRKLGNRSGKPTKRELDVAKAQEVYDAALAAVEDSRNAVPGEIQRSLDAATLAFDQSVQAAEYAKSQLDKEKKHLKESRTQAQRRNLEHPYYRINASFPVFRPGAAAKVKQREGGSRGFPGNRPKLELDMARLPRGAQAHDTKPITRDPRIQQALSAASASRIDAAKRALKDARDHAASETQDSARAMQAAKQALEAAWRRHQEVKAMGASVVRDEQDKLVKAQREMEVEEDESSPARKKPRLGSPFAPDPKEKQQDRQR
ncbi:MAG: hypothetical protein Q9174_007077 [Haloplaca sp. 1 TL-2023]